MPTQPTDYRNIQNGPSQNIEKYQFSISSLNVVSGSLATAGVKHLRIRRVPLGVAGNNLSHRIRISGGVGTAEVVRLGIIVSSATNASPCEITTATAHGCTTGGTIALYGFTGSWVSINGNRVVTVVSSTKFTVAVDSTSFGALSGPAQMGGTAQSGDLEGTLIFTTANTHTGAWRITSATGGIQEWFYGSPDSPNGFLPPGNTTIYEKIVLFGRNGNTVQLTGSGNIASRLVRDPSYPAGDLLAWASVLGAGEFVADNFSILNANGFDNTSGAGLSLSVSQPRECRVSNVTIYNGCSPVVVDPVNAVTGVGTVILNNVYVYTLSSYDIYTKGPSFTINTSISDLINCKAWWDTKPSSGCPGVLISRGDGITIDGGLYSGTYGIQVNPNATYQTSFVYINNVIIDETYSHGVYMPAGAHATILNQFRIQNCHFATQNGDTGAAGIAILNDVDGLIIQGNNISGFQGPGIILGTSDKAPRGAVVNDNAINNNGRSTLKCGILIYSTGTSGSGSYDTNTVISGNSIGNNLAAAYGGSTQEIGIYFVGLAGKFRGYAISGNNLRGNTVIPIFREAGATTVENFVVQGNGGVDDSFTTVASASLSAANAAAFYRNISVTGTTTVADLDPAWEGRQVTLVKLDAGSVSIGGTGTFAGSAVTLSQYGRVDAIYSAAISKYIVK